MLCGEWGEGGYGDIRKRTIQHFNAQIPMFSMGFFITFDKEVCDQNTSLFMASFRQKAIRMQNCKINHLFLLFFSLRF